MNVDLVPQPGIEPWPPALRSQGLSQWTTRAVPLITHFTAVSLSSLSTCTCLLPVCGGLITKFCPTLETPWTIACQAPLSIGFSRQEYCSGLPFPSPGDLPNKGIKPRTPALQQILYWLSYKGSHDKWWQGSIYLVIFITIGKYLIYLLFCLMYESLHWNISSLKTEALSYSPHSPKYLVHAWLSLGVQ